MNKNKNFNLIFILGEIIGVTFLFSSTCEAKTFIKLESNMIRPEATVRSVLLENGSYYLKDNRKTAEVRTWYQFCNAINDQNVNVINVSNSFSTTFHQLNVINRNLSINFLNDSCIHLTHNHALNLEKNSVLEIVSHSKVPIFISRSQLTHPFIQSSYGSTVRFKGEIMIGNDSTETREQPFIRTEGLIEIPSGSKVIMHEAIEANDLFVLSYGSFELCTNKIIPIKIGINGALRVGEFSSLKIIHGGRHPVIQMTGGQIFFDNPYSIHLRQTNLVGRFSPLIHSSGVLMEINAVRNAFWKKDYISPQPSHVWSGQLKVRLGGPHGSQVLRSNSPSFEKNFLGFESYNEYTAGSGIQLYPDTFPE